jgi:putative transposase
MDSRVLRILKFRRHFSLTAVHPCQELVQRSITAWKQAYEEDGIDGLRLNYKGRKSYLLSAQREEVLSWLQTKDIWELGELEYKLAFEYEVVYESKQSYYDLFSEAGISWKKTTKLNPKANPDAVAEKKKRLKHYGSCVLNVLS